MAEGENEGVNVAILGQVIGREAMPKRVRLEWHAGGLVKLSQRNADAPDSRP